MADSEVQKLIIWVGSQAKINQAREQGLIGDDDFTCVTGLPEFALQSEVQAIQVLIPSSASEQNQLADKDFVNSSINNMAAFYVTSDVQGDPFDTRTDLIAGPWYNQGLLRTPTVNDYALVTEDETHDDYTSRYMYDGTQWVWQYTLNNTKFTQAQIDAINSGITDTLVGQITTNENAIGTLSSLTTTAKTDLVSAVNELQGSKQATISDLATIRAGASAGSTAVQPATLNDYVTKNTTQNITGQKTFLRTETAFQDSVARFVSTYNSSNQGWRGRVIIGAKDYTFLIGTYNGMAAIGGHKFSNSATESNADWSDIYFQPDGNKAVYFGGYSWRPNSGWFKVQNNASDAGGKTQVNIGTITNANWKDVAYKGENISDFNNDSGYITGITSSDVTTALGYTPYDNSNPAGYTTNEGTVKSVNNVSPDNNGNVTLVIPEPTGYVPYTGATQAVDLNNKNLKNVSNLAVGTSTVDSNEKILSVGQNRFVTNNQNGLFISSTTSQTRKGMYGVPMALEIQFNSNNQAYSYPLGFHDMNANNNGGQFLFTSFSSAIGAASAGDVMVENDKGGLIFNTGNSKSGAKMRFTVGNWQSTPQLTLTANGVGVKTLNPNSSYAMDVNGTLNATNILINGQPIDVGGDANVQYTGGGGGTETIDLSELYLDSQGATYGFSYDSMSNTIKNDNINVDDSYAYAYIELNLENDGDITISFNQDSEQNYDFGEISELDEYLTQDNQEDTNYVAWSGKEYGTTSDSITFSNIQAGYHFFTIKYIKDSSSESGTDTFEITGIEISGGSAGSLIDTNTQNEIPLSEINDMPQALQAIRDEIPDTSDFVTLSTKQMITAPKAITGTDVPWGSDQVQKNLFMAVSNSNTTGVVEWIGRSMFGANNLTFLMGTINNMAALGAHSWTSAQQGTGAAWADIYINPDGDKAVKIGGSPMVGRPSIMVIQNLGQTTTGTVKINRRAQLTQSALYKDVACWDDDVRKFSFTSISGYSASSNQMLTHDTSGNLKWVNI